MQKLIIICLLLLFSSAGHILNAQENGSFSESSYTKQYPLLVNTQMTTVLMFPAAISPGGVDRGSDAIIARTVDGVGNILKLKAAYKPFTATNLTVITVDGKIYSYYVQYSDYADNRPIDMGKQLQQEAAAAFFKNRKLNDAQVQQLSKHIATRKPFMRRPKDKAFGIRAALQGIYISGDVIFFKVGMANRTHIDYNLDLLRFYVRDKKRVKRTAEQEQEMLPLFVYQEHGKITAGKTGQSLVFAFPKFTIADHKNFIVQLFEKGGDRNLSLKIDGNAIVEAERLAPPLP